MGAGVSTEGAPLSEVAIKNEIGVLYDAGEEAALMRPRPRARTERVGAVAHDRGLRSRARRTRARPAEMHVR